MSDTPGPVPSAVAGTAERGGAGAARGVAKLPSLDAGRFVAAFLVMLFHYGHTVGKFAGAVPTGMLFRGGHAGVEYFFVLSGFIIFYAHRKDLSRPDRIGAFFTKRATRILPMLWLTLLVWGTLRIVLSSQTTNGATDVVTVIEDMLLLPHAGPTVLGVTWTLTRELVFYLLFSVCLFNRRAGFATLAVWQTAVIGCALAQVALGPWGRALLDIHNLGFGIGLLIAAAGPMAAGRHAVWAILFGTACFTALLLLEWQIGGPIDPDFRPLGQTLSPVLYSLAAGIVLIGLASYDEHHVRPERRLIQILGGCSYVLYLVHGLVGSLAVRAIGRLPFVLPSGLVFAVMIAVGIAVSVALHLWVEQPILAWLRARQRAARDRRPTPLRT